MYIMVQEFQKPYVVDCGDLANIVSHQITQDEGVVETLNLLEVLMPP